MPLPVVPTRAARDAEPGAEQASRYRSAAMPAPTIDSITVADDADRWASLGFAVEDGVCALGSVELRFSGGDSGRGILGWSLRDVLSTELDGLATELSTAPGREPAPAHENGVAAIDHVVAMSPFFERGVERLQDAGLDLRRIRDEPTAAGAPRQAFFRLGAEILELVQEPEEIVARAGGPDRPARFWGLALLVEDLDATVATLAQHGGQIRDAVQPGRRIATIRRSAGLAVAVALMSRDERVQEAVR